ncbi:CaiB/BaiF CoA transferase family protein [Rhodococcus sp. NPDC127530]|uniref:CaiB/BaiF CoA transferase family protein n=1 Tax=unclassified Rhodococcus (in: high G+C Gram-positive bacteria) TaxID=192944 RepID=UPI00363C81AB
MLESALKGLKVLDLSRILAGPWCTQNLSDLGADVIKVENPQNGDDTRGWGPPYLGDRAGAHFSAYFIACNRGKRSIAIDFRTTTGAELIRRLVADADVVVENYRSGTLERHGLGYHNLRAINPRIIHLSITGFGPTGPMAGKPGYDYVFQGVGGMMSYTGQPDGTPGDGPLRTGVSVVDLMTGMYATSAVLAALFQRAQTNEGQHIDITLLDVAVALNANQGSNFLVSRQSPQRIGNAHANLAPYEVFPCSDGHLILAIGNDTQFAAFCTLAGIPHVAADERFVTNSDRLRHREVLTALIADLMVTRTRKSWGAALDDAGISWGPINTLADVFADPQVVHRTLEVSAEHPVVGAIPMVRNPMVGADATHRYAPPPLRGEHYAEILSEIDIDPHAVEQLLESGVVGTPQQ